MGSPWFNHARVVTEEMDMRKYVQGQPAVRAIRGAVLRVRKWSTPVVNFRNRNEKLLNEENADERAYEREEEIDGKLHKQRVEAFLAGPKDEAIEAIEWILEKTTFAQPGAIKTVLSAYDELKKLVRVLRGETVGVDTPTIVMGLWSMTPLDRADRDDFVQRRDIVLLALSVANAEFVPF